MSTIFLQVGGFFDRLIPSIGTGAGLNNLLFTVVVSSLVILGVVMIIFMLRNFLKYRYIGEVYKRRQTDPLTGQPMAAIVAGKAGYFTKGGRPVFRIKHGMMPWQQIDIMKLPDPEFMVGNKAIFYQYNVGELLQAKAIMEWNKGNVKIEPVDSTTKSAAKIELRDFSAIFTLKSKLQENAGIAIMGFIFIAGVIAMYFVAKACGSV